MKRKLIAVLCLAFLPSLAFGQTISECSNRQRLTEMAMEVRDRLARGEAEDSLLIWASDIEGPGLQAAAYKAIEAYTFPYQKPSSVSQVVTVMHYMCSKTYRP